MFGTNGQARTLKKRGKLWACGFRSWYTFLSLAGIDSYSPLSFIPQDLVNLHIQFLRREEENKVHDDFILLYVLAIMTTDR